MAEELAGVVWAHGRVRSLVRAYVEREQHTLDALRSRPALADPRTLLDARADEVAALRDRARRTLSHRLDRAADDVDHHRARARALSPLATLQRGYAVVQDGDGHVVTSVTALPAGSALTVRLADGRVHATSTDTEPDHSQPHPSQPQTAGADDE
ncbi:exodeoxyribonuclease VII large subunit [Nocardioides daphniae]